MLDPSKGKEAGGILARLSIFLLTKVLFRMLIGSERDTGSGVNVGDVGGRENCE